MNKTRSLSVPRNPLERLQELESDLGTVPKPMHAANEPTHALANVGTHAPTHEQVNGVRELERTTLLQLLKTPFQNELSKGPFQAATVRMPIEVWRRIDWVAALTGRKKQDIIGEALVAYLERLREQG